MYRIAWRIIATNYSGHGEFCLTYPTAQELIVDLNKKHPDMIHWIEEEPIKQN